MHRVALLAEAEVAARASLEARGIAEDPINAGETWSQLARVLMEIGDRAGAVDAYRQALTGLTPVAAPRQCREVARVLASIAAEDGDWRAAAEFWETAVAAAVAAVESRASNQGRLEEIRKNLNIFRWAAYALTREMKLERAVEVLELGRGRELAAWLRRDLIDLDQLGHFDPALSHRVSGLLRCWPNGRGIPRDGS